MFLFLFLCHFVFFQQQVWNTVDDGVLPSTLWTHQTTCYYLQLFVCGVCGIGLYLYGYQSFELVGYDWLEEKLLR